MLAGRIGHPGAGHVRLQGEFGTEHRRHREFLCGLGESDHTVEAVVVGDRQTGQIESGRLLHHLLGHRRPVEETVGTVRVQFRVAHRRSLTRHLRRRVGASLARPRGAVVAVARLLGTEELPGTAAIGRAPRQHPLHLPPRRRALVPAHSASIEHVFDTGRR